MNLDLLCFYVFIYFSIYLFLILTLFNYVCVSAFEQGQLDPWRSKIALIIIIIILLYNKNDADPHFEINGTAVFICEKTIHQGNVLSTIKKYEMMFDGLKTFNCGVNRFMSEFVSSVLLCIMRISTMAAVAWQC